MFRTICAAPLWWARMTFRYIGRFFGLIETIFIVLHFIIWRVEVLIKGRELVLMGGHVYEVVKGQADPQSSVQSSTAAGGTDKRTDDKS